MSEQLIREIEEDLRRDKALKLWKRFRLWIIGAAALVVVGVATYVAWRAWEENRRNEQASAYAAAEALAASGKQDQAAAAFEALAADAENGYGGLALMRAAEAKLAAGNRDSSQAGFEAVAAHGDLDPALKATATLKAASLAIRTETPDQIRARVSGLIDSKENWRPLAEELVALAAFKAGDTQRAGEIFARLADDADAPQDLRDRAASYAHVLGGPIASETAAEVAPADTESTDAEQGPAK